MVILFRNVVIFSYVLYAAFVFIAFFSAYLYDQKTLDILTWNNYGTIIQLSHVFGYLFFFAYTVIFLGLIYFKSWARTAFVILTLLSVILTGIQGIEILPAIEGLLSYLMNLSDGAIIALMYFTSISSKFSNNA